jgi:RNA polymerase sigma-70 factor (ECF subfamily)
MTDHLTAALAADLDAAFERVVLAHQDRLYSIALRLLGDPRDAEELAQDALVRAYRAIGTYEPARIRALDLRPWLATIVVNLCRNRSRRRSATIVRLDPAAAPDERGVISDVPDRDPADSPHEAAARREANRRWAALLATLPDRYRYPVVLRHVDGMSYDEMATVLGRPEGTLKAQVHRGLAQLRAAAERAADLDRQEMTA